MSSDPLRVAARRKLGAELRSLREQRQVTGQQLAERLGWSQSKVSRIEGARTRSEVDDVRAILRSLDVSAPLRADLIALAEEAAGPAEAWRNSSRVGLTRRQQDFVNNEASAVRVRHYQPLLVPGYLQTPAYARRVLELAGSTDIDRAVTMRQARGAVLAGDGAPTYEIVLMETSLRWRPFARALMVEQLEYLDAASRRKNLTLRVISLAEEQSAYIQHPFVIYDFGGSSPAEVLVEAAHADSRLTDTADVETYLRWFEKLTSTALSPARSMRLVRDVAQQLQLQNSDQSMEGR